MYSIRNKQIHIPQPIVLKSFAIFTLFLLITVRVFKFTYVKSKLYSNSKSQAL